MAHRTESCQINAGNGLLLHPTGGMMMAMFPRSPLDDPENAAHAWARYRRVMRFMMGVTVGVVILAIAALYRQTGEASAHYYIAAALGVGFTMLLGSALMGLMFLSSGTGHDEAVNNPPDDDRTI